MNPLLQCDMYKISHREQYPQGTTRVYSVLCARSFKHAPFGINKCVVFGIEDLIKNMIYKNFQKNFFNRNTTEVINEYRQVVANALSIDEKEVYTDHIKQLKDLTYLPIEIRALPEGTCVGANIPILTITNTHKDFAWLVGYLETLISCSIWQPIVSATIAANAYQLALNYANPERDLDKIDYLFHDFSMRGMSSMQTAVSSGMGHLAFFKGSDTIPAYLHGKELYSDIELKSIPATEHSVMSSYGNDVETIKHFLKTTYKGKVFSVVCDTYDFWGVIRALNEDKELHDLVKNNTGKIVFRPDSGNPYDILVGEKLPNLQYPLEKSVLNYSLFHKDIVTFPFQFSALNENGELEYFEATKDVYDELVITKIKKKQLHFKYLGLVEALYEIFEDLAVVDYDKVKYLPPNIGAIYGDSITLELADRIMNGLQRKGFSPFNVVFGIGSFSYQYNTRDTFGFAIKATYIEIEKDGAIIGKEIFKNPKTDTSKIKKSLKGIVDTNNLLELEVHSDMGDLESMKDKSALKTVFKDGVINKEKASLKEVRDTFIETKDL